jgi:hypothetical protein
VAYFFSMAGLIACKDVSRLAAFSCPWPPSLTFYKLREIERLELLELDEAQWLKVQQRAWYRRPRQMRQMAEQLPLLDVAGSVACLVPALLMYGMGENFFRHVFTLI